MKKTLLTGAFLLGSLLTMNAQQTIFEDNFDSYNNFIITGIGTWTQIDGDESPTYGIEVGGAPVEFENSGYVGTAIIFNPSATNPPLENWEPASGAKSLNFFAASQSANDDWFITPKLTMAATGNSVTFKARSLTDQFGLEKMAVTVSTTGNTNPADFTAISAGVSVSVPVEWTTYTFPLDTYAGQDIYIAIHYVSDDAFALLVDDFSVKTGGTAGLNDVLASKLSVSPNPANDIVTISNGENIFINSVEVVDLNGRVVKMSKYDGVAEAKINISDLSSGLYMMNVSSDKGSVVRKIIKN